MDHIRPNLDAVARTDSPGRVRRLLRGECWSTAPPDPARDEVSAPPPAFMLHAGYDLTAGRVRVAGDLECAGNHRVRYRCADSLQIDFRLALCQFQTTEQVVRVD